MWLQMLYQENTTIEPTNMEIKKSEGGDFSAVTRLVLAWYKDIYGSYNNDKTTQEIIISMIINASRFIDFTYQKAF